MDRQEIESMQCRKFKLRPMARRIELTGLALHSTDDWWRVLKLSDRSLRLTNSRTRHSLALRWDGIANAIADPQIPSSGWLILKCQVVIKGSLAYLVQAHAVGSAHHGP